MAQASDPAKNSVPDQSQRNDKEIKTLHAEMDQVRQRIEQSIGKFEVACESNSKQLGQLENDLLIHIEHLKKDAMARFAEQQYRECLGVLRFLCDLEPGNRTLRRYLELSRQRIQETGRAIYLTGQVDPKDLWGALEEASALSDADRLLSLTEAGYASLIRRKLRFRGCGFGRDSFKTRGFCSERSRFTGQRSRQRS